MYIFFSSQTTWLGPCFLQASWQTSHHNIMYPPIHHIPLIIFLQLATLHYQRLMFFFSIEKVSSHYQLPPFFLGQMKATKYCTQPNSPNDDFYIIHVCSSLCMINLLPNKDITVLATIHSKPSLGLSTCPWKLLHKWRLLHYFCWQI